MKQTNRVVSCDEYEGMRNSLTMQHRFNEILRWAD